MALLRGSEVSYTKTLLGTWQKYSNIKNTVYYEPDYHIAMNLANICEYSLKNDFHEVKIGLFTSGCLDTMYKFLLVL